MKMKRILQTYGSLTHGVAAVEFALLAPLLIVLIIGTIDFAMFIQERMRIHNVANASAEYVVQVQDDANLLVVAEEAYQGNFIDLELASSFECECSDGAVYACPVSCSSGDYQRRFVVFDVSGQFEAMFPYPGLPQSVSIETSVRRRVD